MTRRAMRRPNYRLVRLHVATDGQIWYGWDGLPAEPTRLRLPDATPSALFDGLVDPDTAVCFRLVAIPANYPLTRRLVRWAADRPLPVRIELAPPKPTDPFVPAETVLTRLWQLPAAAVRVCGRAELLAYTFAFLRFGPSPVPPAMLCPFAALHPAWPALTFPAGSEPAAAVDLLASIQEPRWFTHPSRPYRLSRLVRYFGLTPKAVADALGNRHTHPRLLVLLRACNGRPVTDAGPRGRWARWSTSPRGVYLACRNYLRLVVTVWRAETAYHPEVAFDPEQFFSCPQTAAAYRQHRRSLLDDASGIV